MCTYVVTCRGKGGKTLTDDSQEFHHLRVTPQSRVFSPTQFLLPQWGLFFSNPNTFRPALRTAAAVNWFPVFFFGFYVNLCFCFFRRISRIAGIPKVPFPSGALVCTCFLLKHLDCFSFFYFSLLFTFFSALKLSPPGLAWDNSSLFRSLIDST